VVASQVGVHAKYGGVFPELASRMHIEAILPVVQEALGQAHIGLEGIEAIAVTRGPGLAGSLVVGLNCAKGLALSRGLPLIGVNHLEGHLYSIWLVEGEPEPVFPMLALIVSGTLSGAAGSVYALLFSYVGATFASVLYSIYPILWTLLGGAGTTLGPLVGVSLMTYIVDITSGFTSSYMLVVGLALVLIIMKAPAGVVGGIRERWLKWLP